jgi:polyphosphate kinase 2 (PPK2 family)
VARLADADLSLKLSREAGETRLLAAQRRMLALRLQCGGLIGDGTLGPPLAVMFEGWDAAGKGGGIKRLTDPLDPRHFQVVSFAAPTDREKRHHYMWRFWPWFPGWGGMTVFDRSWYGRVLVERVEGLASPAEWKRAYREIAAFEQSLAAEGTVLVKFWMHLSAGEQNRRLNARKRDPLKSWKLTDEDWRNFGKRDEYEPAVAEMLRRTDHKDAPWTVIAAENKRYARVAVLEAVIAALEQGMRAAGQEPLAIEVEV